MPLLPDIKTSGIQGEDQLSGVVKQINEWGRQISNETRTLIINDDSGTPIILIGFLQDGF